MKVLNNGMMIVLLVCKEQMTLFALVWGFVLSDLNAPVEDFVACYIKYPTQKSNHTHGKINLNDNWPRLVHENPEDTTKLLSLRRSFLHRI